MIKYLVVFEKTKTGYSAYSPDLTGCIATGSSLEETEKNIYEAIQFHIEGMKEENLKLPKSYAEAEVMVFAN